MSFLHPDEANVFHHPILHGGRIIEADGVSLVSRAKKGAANASRSVDELLAKVLKDTRAAERPPDIALDPERLTSLAQELGTAVLSIWLGSGPTEAVVLRGSDKTAYAILMPMKCKNPKPLDMGADLPDSATEESTDEP